MTRAAFWCVLATVMFAIVPIGVRMASETLPTVEVVCFRGALAVLCVLPFYIRSGLVRLRTRNTKLYAARAAINGFGMVLWFWGMTVLPLDQAVALHFTLPLFAVVLAAIFLGERLNRGRLFATLVGFAGVLVILRPGAAPIGTAAIGLIVSAACYAASVILLKIISRSDEPGLTTFHGHLWLMGFTLVPTIWFWVTPDWRAIQGLAILGVSGTLAPYLFARAVRLVDAAAIMPLDFLRLPMNAAVGIMLYAEMPDLWAFAGGAIIFASAYLNTRWESRARGDRGGREQS